MTAGGLESDSCQQAVSDFQKALESRGYTHLLIKTLIVPGEGHSGQKAEAYNRGLRFVFEK